MRRTASRGESSCGVARRIWPRVSILRPLARRRGALHARHERSPHQSDARTGPAGDREGRRREAEAEVARLDAWHWAAIATLGVLALSEAVGGYFAFRFTIRAALEPNDSLQIFRQRRWMRFWIEPVLPDGNPSDPAYGRSYRWRPEIAGAPFLAARGVIRVLAGATLLALQASGHGWVG